MIRKTAFLVTGTVTGLVAVLSYNPPDLNGAIASTSGEAIGGTVSTPEPINSATSDSSPRPEASKATSTKKPSKQQATTTATEPAVSPTEKGAQSPTPVSPIKAAGVSGTFRGETSPTRWGPVQVQITVADGKITDVTTLQYPDGDRRSQMISSQVIPWLQQETLQIQSADISGISGATYTSNGFKTSLASALQKAGI